MYCLITGVYLYKRITSDKKKDVLFVDEEKNCYVFFVELCIAEVVNGLLIVPKQPMYGKLQPGSISHNDLIKIGINPSSGYPNEPPSPIISCFSQNDLFVETKAKIEKYLTALKEKTNEESLEICISDKMIKHFIETVLDSLTEEEQKLVKIKLINTKSALQHYYQMKRSQQFYTHPAIFAYTHRKSTNFCPVHDYSHRLGTEVRCSYCSITKLLFLASTIYWKGIDYFCEESIN